MQITNIFNYIIQLHSIKKWKSTTRVSKQEDVAVAKIRKLGWKMQLGSSRSRRFFFFLLADRNISMLVEFRSFTCHEVSRKTVLEER